MRLAKRARRLKIQCQPATEVVKIYFAWRRAASVAAARGAAGLLAGGEFVQAGPYLGNFRRAGPVPGIKVGGLCQHFEASARAWTAYRWRIDSFAAARHFLLTGGGIDAGEPSSFTQREAASGPRRSGSALA